MKNYFYILLFFSSLSFAQTEFTAIKLKSNPVTLNDITQVDLLVREAAGANKGVVRKVTWEYLANLFAPANMSLQGTLENSSSATISHPLSIIMPSFSFLGGASGQITANASTGITISGNAGGIILNGASNGVEIDGQGGSANIKGGSEGLILDGQSSGTNFYGSLYTINNHPFNYVTDFSGEYIERSLVDKGYVDSADLLSVPYSGAMESLDLGENNLISANIYTSDGLNNWLIADSDGILRAHNTIQILQGDDISEGYFAAISASNSLTNNRVLVIPDASGTLTVNGISLSGTTNGNPVTGDINVEDGVTIKEVSGTGGINIGDSTMAALAIGGSYVKVIGNGNLVGIRGQDDYTANITDLDYTQKKYVDDADDARINPTPVDGSLTTTVSSNWIYDYAAAIASGMADKVSVTGNETITGIKTFSAPPVFPTPSANDNSTKGATTAYVDASTATKITNGGNTTGAAVTIGSNDAQTVSIEYNNTPVLTVVSTAGISLPNGASITNASSSGRGSILMGTTSAGVTIQRNVADAIPGFTAVNAHTSSTGHIADFNSNISSATATRAYVSKDGTFVAPKYTLSALNTAPSSSTDTGTTGEIRITAAYIYVCTATNTWVRSALTTW